MLAAGNLVEAAEPFLKPNDVIAFVGGEEMVATAESGQLELLLSRALPELKLKFRSLAWEGDTVFEQPRDLNYPTLEQQLEEISATVVLAQFGQMESRAGPAKLPEFIAAYEKLIDRLGGGGKRRVVVLGPPPSPRFKSIEAYGDAIRGLAQRRGLRCLIPDEASELSTASFRDGVHLNENGQAVLAVRAAQELGAVKRAAGFTSTEDLRLADTIRAKNRLWYHYARPQNWAFLNGDRTVQPSSRDHLDPSKRWFPEEMKLWLPLIETKEKEIWSRAEEMRAK